MIWPIRGPVPGVYYANARLMQVVSDEVSGDLRIRAVFDEREERELVYEGMYYSQLDESSVGFVVTLAAEITPAQLIEPEYRQAAARLYDDCGADDAFLRDMHKRGSRLFIHYTDKGGYLVLAKRLIWEKQETSQKAGENTNRTSSG
ncbi:hypothetical protein [Desulfosporosinus orientis]|nr:hypothetical protein [Desulfosporosinus orientis]